MKVHLKNITAKSFNKSAFGIGRAYSELSKSLSFRNDVSLSTLDTADLSVTLCFPYDRWDAVHWWGRNRTNKVKEVIYCPWETTVPPDHWIEVIKTYDAMMVPSEFNRDVFSRFVDIPVWVIPHGVDTGFFKYIERNWFEPDNFVFLWQGIHMQDRKGAGYALEAFRKANLDGAYLVQKTYPIKTKNMKAMVILDDGKVQQIRKIMNSDEYISLLAQCHVSINPYHGEGFALMPLECGSTGMAVMATDWSGPLDYLNDDFWRIKYSLCEPGDDYINSSVMVDTVTNPAQDAIPDVDHIAEGMRYLYEHRMDAMNRGKKISEYAKKFSWDRAANEFVKACKEIIDA